MKYRLKDGVTTVTVPGWAINLGAKFGDLDDEEKEITNLAIKANEDLETKVQFRNLEDISEEIFPEFKEKTEIFR